MGILIVLFIGAIFFPPLWVAFITYIIYLIMTAKTRRNKQIDYVILSLIAQKRFNEEVHLQHLYYAPVQKYAIEHGAKIYFERHNPANNIMGFFMEVGEEEYYIQIAKVSDGSASLRVTPREELSDFAKKLTNMMNL